MTRKTWVPYVADINVEFDHEIHCTTTADDTFAWDMEEAEGADGASVSVTRKQKGWRILGEDQPRAVLIVESATGLPEDAFVRARVSLGEAPGDLFTTKQSLRGKAAPSDIAARILTYAKANCASGPETDLLFSDADPDSAETYLLGRAATWYVDPATHEISLNPILDGRAPPVDLTAHVHWKDNPPTDGPVDTGGPVKNVVAKLDFSFTQAAKGACNLAARLGEIKTMNPDFITHAGRELPDGFLDARLGAGWTYIGKSQTRLRLFETGELWNGRVRRRRFRMDRDVVDTMPPASWYHTRTEQQWCTMAFGVVDVWAAYMQYDLQQERQEVCYFEMAVPVQSSTVTVDATEPIELSLGDLFAEPDAEVWEADTAYVEGTHVVRGGIRYRAARDVPAQNFFELFPNQPVRGYLSLTDNLHPFWEQVPSQAAQKFAGAASFLDTDRGRQVKEHVLCRMRKEAMLRLRARTITMNVSYEAAAAITMKDEVKLLVPFSDVQLAPVVGKVIAIKRSWPSMAAPTAQITIAVPFGDGTDDTVDAGDAPVYADDYVQDGYVEAGAAIYGVADDVAWTEEADPIPRPIDVRQLSNPAYSVDAIVLLNQADVQFQAAVGYGYSGLDPRNAIADNPTRLQVFMKPIITEGSLLREFDVQATLLRGKRGIDLTLGGEL